MKSFSYDLSPINNKSTNKEYLISQLAPKLGIIDHSDSDNFIKYLPNPNISIQQRIIAASRTIVYLFSPDIDLLQNIQNNIENYDKYQKTKLLLRELMHTITQSDHLQVEVMKTTQQIQLLKQQIDELSLAFHQLASQNEQKDGEISKYKNAILELSKGYEQAKIYYEDQILELKYMNEELRHTIQKQLSKNKSKNDSKSKKVLLEVPEKKRRNDNEAYTDRSIYLRFGSSQMKQDRLVKQSQQVKQNKQKFILKGNFSSQYHIVQKYQFEIQNLQRRIVEYELKIKRYEQQLQKCRRQQKDEVQKLSNKISSYQVIIQQKSTKIKAKNKQIMQLLDCLQNKNT